MRSVLVHMDDREFEALCKMKEKKGAKSWLQFMRLVK